MARKSNHLLAQLEAKHEQEMAFFRTFTIQQCVDFMMIAANETFGFGPERLDRLETAFYDVFKEYALMTMADAKDDKDISYTKGKVDMKLRQIMGDDHFVPWEQRYGG